MSIMLMLFVASEDILILYLLCTLVAGQKKDLKP